MSRNRTSIWLAVFSLGVGLVLLAIPGVRMFMRTTATQLHPKPQEAPSVTEKAPPLKWAGAVEQGRQIVRTSLSKQNLPGVSVAVGMGVEIV